MEIIKTNEQYQINDTYVYEEAEYPLSGNLTKSSNNINVWFSIEGVGSVSYTSSNSNSSINVDRHGVLDVIPMKEFIADMYDKAIEAIQNIED